MLDKVLAPVITIIGVSALAVVVSKKSDTARVLTAFTDGVSKMIGAATSPIK